MREPMYAPGGPATMPTAEGGRVDAALIWHNAVSGRGKEPSWADTRAAAATWQGQFVPRTEEEAEVHARVAAGRAAVAAAKAKHESAPAVSAAKAPIVAPQPSASPAAVQAASAALAPESVPKLKTGWFK